MWLRKLFTLPAQFRGMRRAIRPGCTDSTDFANALELFTLGSTELAALITAGKRLDVTVNDLLLALLMWSFAPLCEPRGATGAIKFRSAAS